MRYGHSLTRRLFVIARGPLTTGLVVGLLSWAACSQFLIAWGTGPTVVTSIAIAVILAASTRLAVRMRSNTSLSIVWLATAAWTVISPFVLAFTMSPGASTLDAPWQSFLATLTSALLFLAPGFALLGRVLDGEGRDGMRRATAALGTTWCLAPLTIGIWPGPHAMSLVAAAVLLARFTRALTSEVEATSPTKEQAVGTSPGPLAVALLSAAAAGAAVAIVQWVQVQLFLPTAALWCATWGGLLLGVAVGLRPLRSCDHLSKGARHLAAVGLLVAFLAAGFPMLLRTAMSISGTVSWLPAIVGFRTFIVACLAFAPGAALGCAFSAAGASPGISPVRKLAVLMSFCGALCAAYWLDVTLFSATPFVVACCGAALGLWLLSARSSDVQSRLQWTTLAAAGVAVAAVCANDPGRSLKGQRGLFSGTHFQARALGVPNELLPAIDDGRLMHSSVSTHGVTSVWAHSAVQWVLRENGLTRGVVSTQPDLCPQSVPEVLTAVLPLTMHPRPHHILVTSASYPTIAATCLMFPVESVTAIDDNPAAVSFCRNAAERICTSLTRGDNRLALHCTDPVRGLATAGRLYDVIISPNSIVGDVNSVRQWTAEHLQQVAAHLSVDGIFCQRVTCFDLNVEPVLDLVRTAQTAFPVVQLNEVSPGEWLLVARIAPEAGLDKTFLQRLEKPHVRDVLAQAGWDWSIMLSLKTVHPTDLRSAAAGASSQTTVDARMAYALAVDVMRWGSKFEMRRRWMANHSRPLGDALGQEPALADVAQRLSDVTLAQQVMIDHPDQFSAYRHFVKKRLQDRPRPKVIQVDGGGLKNGLDPEDARRKVYLTALGQAVETKSRHDIDRLTQFFSPFDPLIAPFIPREVIQIDRQSENPSPAAQWRCGLRSVFYAPPNDCSVNNVCDALEVLRSGPEVAGSPAAQWDCCNALLEVLKNRWGMRIAAGASLKYGVADAHRTLELAAASLEQMEHLREQAGIPEEEWNRRHSVLEKHLIRPVRSWRTEQSARFALQAATERRPAEQPIAGNP